MSSGRTWGRRHVPWYRRITRGHVGLAAVVVLLFLLLFFVIQASRANSSLRLAANQAEVLQSQIVAGDDASARITLRQLQQSTARAADTTDGPMWKVGSKLPFIGKNIDAVQTVSQVTHDIATDALPPVVALSNQINLNTFSPKNGKINIAEIRKIAPSVKTATAALTAAQKDLSGIDATSLLAPLRGPVETIQDKVDNAQSAAKSSNLAAELLPTMLGGKGTRRYMLLIQNNAEIRSTGGIPGSFAILKAKNGKLSMGEQGALKDLPPFDEPVLKMTKNESTVFTPTLVTNLLDTTVTPDFPRTGEIVRAMVEKGLDLNVDGVISVDPVALSYVLAGTGPVPVANGTLNQYNAVPLLLNQTYALQPDRDKQDDIFKVSARAIFDVMKSGRGEPRLVIDGLVQAASENRLMVWSSHKDEQRRLLDSPLSGELSGNGGKTPHVGMYIGDAASTKMEYYLEYSTTLRSDRCLQGGVQQLSTSTELTSTAPLKAASLPVAVTGDGAYTPRGTMRLIIRFYSPYAGGFTDVRLDGKPQTVYADSHRGRNVTKVLLTLKPGRTYTITTSMISGRNEPNDPVFSTTPGVQRTPNDVVVKSACS
ncbi:DUF4012 domain-containing protein [Aeromicrobium ginsengisoli]|uniref:DUF4012 domain-containing protein n=1 Tax=Aeromicrobium ginsengisoli TaxID=363867 RepID=A0A5M4F9Y1_9ACTN|nr:DUF4012 domain-containing protein [Aeromicrobium ginsengisoli]